MNTHVPVNQNYRRDKQGVEKYWENLEKATREMPNGDVKIVLGNFNAQGEKKYSDE